MRAGGRSERDGVFPWPASVRRPMCNCSRSRRKREGARKAEWLTVSTIPSLTNAISAAPPQYSRTRIWWRAAATDRASPGTGARWPPGAANRGRLRRGRGSRGASRVPAGLVCKPWPVSPAWGRRDPGVARDVSYLQCATDLPGARTLGRRYLAPGESQLGGNVGRGTLRRFVAGGRESGSAKSSGGSRRRAMPSASPRVILRVTKVSPRMGDSWLKRRPLQA
jgi:hypothetical protein